MPGGMCLASMEHWVGVVMYLFCSHLRDIWGGLWISFGLVHCGRGLISVFQDFLVVLTKFSFWGIDIS